MQSNIEEHRLADTKRTYVERIVLSAFGAFCGAVLAVTDSRAFMIVMHTISFSVVVVCLVMAFRTGKYGTYLVSAGTIAVLSFLWPEFTTRTLDKWRKDREEQRKRD